jgi:hypothetical protein
MAFPILALMAIGMAVDISSRVAGGIMQSSENAKNRDEMRSLADIQRKDDQNRNRNNNALTQRSLDLRQQQADFSKQMANLSIDEKEKEKSYVEGTTNQSYLKGMSSRLLDPQSRLSNTRRFI